MGPHRPRHAAAPPFAHIRAHTGTRMGMSTPIPLSRPHIRHTCRVLPAPDRFLLGIVPAPSHGKPVPRRTVEYNNDGSEALGRYPPRRKAAHTREEPRAIPPTLDSGRTVPGPGTAPLHRHDSPAKHFTDSSEHPRKVQAVLPSQRKRERPEPLPRNALGEAREAPPLPRSPTAGCRLRRRRGSVRARRPRRRRRPSVPTCR